MVENEILRSSLTATYHFGLLVGDSDPMLKVYRLIEKVSKTNSTVLILGESGTGKELVARSLHLASPRHEGPFVTVNCGAMPEPLLESELFGYVKGAFTGATSNKKGLFETANGGTIFLDEISSMPANMQMKLLRVLQEKEIRRVGGTESQSVDVRVVAASNENLERKIAEGGFREDLYYRLSVIPIKIPPLRERPADIAPLAQHFLSQFAKENGRTVGMTQDAMKIIESYSWPGNVRQLENTIKRVATLCEGDAISESDLPPEMSDASGGGRAEGPFDKATASSPGKEAVPLKEYLRDVETAYMRSVLEKCGGDKEEAARRLGISLATFYRKLNGDGE